MVSPVALMSACCGSSWRPVIAEVSRPGRCAAPFSCGAGAGLSSWGGRCAGASALIRQRGEMAQSFSAAAGSTPLKNAAMAPSTAATSTMRRAFKLNDAARGARPGLSRVTRAWSHAGMASTSTSTASGAVIHALTASAPRSSTNTRPIAA